MYGYIYITTNKINNRVYVGKHQSEEYDPKYYGSGKILKQAINKYGVENFVNEMIATANTLEELNQKEKEYIDFFSSIYGESVIYNLAAGGDGGNVILHMTLEQKQEFIDKMTIINTERARKEEYRKNIGKKVKQYYDTHPEARIKQSEKIKAYWTPEKRKQHGELIKARPKEIKDKTGKACQKKCIFELNNIHKEFDSVKEIMVFLKEEYGWHPDRRTFNKVMDNGAKGIPYKSFHSKQSNMDGMIIYRIKDREGVSTKGDECSPVEPEISTGPKSEAM